MSLVINEKQIRTIMKCKYTLCSMASIHRPTVAGVGKDVEQSRHSYTAFGEIKGYDHFGITFGSFF